MTLHHGDCLAILPTLDAESIDAICTDPPYDLTDTTALRLGSAAARSGLAPKGRTSAARGFMGKAWDGTGIAFRAETWAEALRVAKPGAYLLAFGGTRTFHRLACAIEDAGWEIRDTLVWAYASGFPKSLNLPGGLGTALKPAWEPIVMARKPLRGTVAANVAEYGTGVLNIDGCRIGTTQEERDWIERTARPNTRGDRHDGAVMNRPAGPTVNVSPLGRWPANLILTDALFDGDTPGVVGGGWQSGGGNPTNRYAQNGNGVTMGDGWATGATGLEPFDTEGTYSRFFLIPKAARSDREPVLGGLPEGMVAGRSRADGRQWDIPGSTLDNGKRRRANVHPTVKPTDLMRHLVRLVTPPGGLVLDPFLGSGTTALACELEGFGWVGIEREESYVEIARARLNGIQRGLGLDVGAPIPRRNMSGSLEEKRAKGFRHAVNDPTARSRKSVLMSGLAGEERSPIGSVDEHLLPGMAGPTEGDEVA